jgi:hypothetical protein
MPVRNVRAKVISRRGSHGDAQYAALHIEVEGFRSPYVAMTLPAIGYHALANETDTAELFEKLAEAINAAEVKIASRAAGHPLATPS